MPSLATFVDLRKNDYALALYCIECNRWDIADLDRLVAIGRGQSEIVSSRFRCKDCGCVAEKQVRPPVPTISRAVAYI